MGGYSILVGAFMLIGAIAIFAYKDLYLKEVANQMTDEQLRQLDSMKGLMGKIITAMQIFLFLYGSSIIVNALLSLSFLQQWKKKQEDDKHIDLDLDA